MDALTSLDDIFDLPENNPKMDKSKTAIIDSLSQALSDWPSPVDELEEFIKIVEDQTNSNGNLKAIQTRLKYFEKNVSTMAWQCESFSNLVDVFKIDSNKTLREIIEELLK